MAGSLGGLNVIFFKEKSSTIKRMKTIPLKKTKKEDVKSVLRTLPLLRER